MASLIDLNQMKMDSLGRKIPTHRRQKMISDHPKFLAEFHPTKNGNLDPYNISHGSRIVVWWQCREHGHEWQSSVNTRISNNVKCPFCSNQRVLAGFNDLQTTHPQIAEQWHPTQNGDLTPQDITYGSHKKVWWKDSNCGHEYDMEIYQKAGAYYGCPYCSNNRVLTGFNDLATTHPHLLEEWDYEKNTINPTEVIAGSGLAVYWVGKICKHKWDAKIQYRARENHGCPYCSSHRVLAGFNDLATAKPHILAEWDYENNTIKPTEILPNSNKAIFWKCKKCNHQWELPLSKKRDFDCPKCFPDERRFRSKLPLSVTHPHVLKEWDYDKNTINPTTISAKSKKKVFWKCEQYGHEWSIAIYHRTITQTQCPYCAGRKVLAGFNDLATTHPYLLEEWDYEKNALRPTEILAGSELKINWKCSRNHTWITTPKSRTRQHTGCPHCISGNQTSYAEQFLFFYINKVISTAKNKSIENKPDWLNGKELDIIIPELKRALEYDGQLWHADVEKDIDKTNICLKHGIKLFRVREIGCPHLSNNNDVFIVRPGKITDLREAVLRFLNFCEIDNIDDNLFEEPFIYNRYKIIDSSNSLKEKYPVLSKYWDEKKNDITADNISFGASGSYYFVCENCGISHSAILTRKTRQFRKTNKCLCSTCAKSYGLMQSKQTCRSNLRQGGNLQHVYPDVVQYWDYQKNELNPDEVSFASNKKFNFVCSDCGISHTAQVCNKTRQFTRAGRCLCPSCSAKNAGEKNRTYNKLNPTSI